MNKVLTEKDISLCCGDTPEYFFTATHQLIRCNLCKREEHVTHGWRDAEDFDLSPNYNLDILVRRWNK